MVSIYFKKVCKSLFSILNLVITILWTFAKFKKSILSLESLKWVNLFKLRCKI